MSKLTKQELMHRIGDLVKDNEDLHISILEDLDDSIVENNVDETIIDQLKQENENLKYKYENLRQRYKDRFFDNVDEKIIDDENDKTLEEKEIIDVKEI